MWKKTIPIVLMIIFSLSTIPIHKGMSDGSTTTTMSVVPQNNFGLTPGSTLSINITVSNVTDLFAWQFYLYYQSSVLNGTEIDPGNFFPSPDSGSTYFVGTPFTDNYNATYGYMYVGETLVGNVGGVSGSGTLATIKFKVVGIGLSILHLDKTILSDSSLPFGNLIPHTVIDGQAYAGNVDLAVGKIDTLTNIPKGSMAYINVTAQNRGQPTETFDVTLYYNSNPIETKSVANLPGGGTQILNFTWDTTPIPIGQYTLKATIPPVVGETDLTDNTLSVNVYVGTRDIAITSVDYKTSIPSGLPGTKVQVTVKNMGQATETFDVALTSNSQPVAMQTTTLNAGAIGTVSLTWNTTELQYGNYTLQAYIPPLPYQTTTVNFTWHAVVTIPGDVNGDGKVGLVDLVTLAQSYGSTPGNAKWSSNADIDGNGIVGLSDLVILANHYGKSLS